MSRIGKRPVKIPNGVQVTIQNGVVHVKGPKGFIDYKIPEYVTVAVKDQTVLVQRVDDERPARSRHGVVQSVIQNMVNGVSQGFSKTLEIQGVGFRAAVKGKTLELALGFSHPVLFPIPDGIAMKVANQTVLTIEGFNKEQVGQVAANIRDLKPPEPYQGKGIRYLGEVVRRKVGKAAAGASGGA